MKVSELLKAAGVEPFYFDEKADIAVVCGDARDVLPKLPAGCVDSVVSDPPYAEIDRDYGRLTEPEWHALMDVIVPECRRVLTPIGSAIFILQPNSERVGRMRPWLWEFMAKWSREWGMVQDAYWWNFATPPTVHCHETNGLMRPSMKACVWLGASDCYRDQGAALLPIAEATLTDKRIDRHELGYSPSGLSMRHGRSLTRCREREGSTPFNVIVCSNSDCSGGAGSMGHGAGTPTPLVNWWLRYITPDKGITLDPFVGSGTMLEAAKGQFLHAIGIEKEEKYCRMAAERLQRDAQEVLFT